MKVEEIKKSHLSECRDMYVHAAKARQGASGTEINEFVDYHSAKEHTKTTLKAMIEELEGLLKSVSDETHKDTRVDGLGYALRFKASERIDQLKQELKTLE